MEFRDEAGLPFRHHDPDLAGFLVDLEILDQPWPGMGSDIDLALRIMVEYQRQGRPLRLIEDFEIDGTTGEVRVRMPEWQTRIIVEFTSLFDEAEARYRYLKTYNELVGKRMAAHSVH
jgi:hypothetical protein